LTDSDLEYAFYEKFFFSQNLEPTPAQELALSKVFSGQSVMVTVPTGTGKTMIA
jgi:Lhr-like helicase